MTLFSTVHSGISNILTCRKRGVDGSPIIGPLSVALKSGSQHVSKAERNASAGAVIVASKLLLADTLKNEQVELMKLFEISFDLLESAENLPSLKWSNIRPIFVALIPNLPENTPNAIVFANLFLKILEFVGKSETILADFYSPENLVILSKTLTCFLEIIEDETHNCDIKLRNLGLSIVKIIVKECPNSKLTTISTVIPGILSKLYLVATNNANENCNILQDSLKLFSLSVTKCWSDSSFQCFLPEFGNCSEIVPEKLKKMLVNRNSVDWRNESAENIRKYITVICSNLVQHRSYLIRNCVAEIVYEIQKSCKETFADLIFPVLIDCYLILIHDDMKCVRDSAQQLFLLISATNKNDFEKRLYEKLDELTNRLPTATRSGKSEHVLKMLRSVICGLDAGVEMLCISRSSVILALVRALADCVRIELKRLMISRSEEADNLRERLGRFELANNVRHDNIRSVICELSRNCKAELLDIFYSEMIQCSTAEKCSYSILISYYFDNMILKLIDILYILLLECSSTCWMIVESAEFALGAISECAGRSVSEMLSFYGGYVVHKIALACSSSKEHNYAPIVFQSFLDRCEDCAFFESSVHIVEKLMDALDRFDQIHTISILQALCSFSKAVNKWYPEQVAKKMPSSEGIDEDDEESRLIATPQMVIVERILNRTKHMLTSRFLPIRVVTLEIVENALWTLRNFEELLLPMVHQNWQGALVVVRDKEPVACVCVIRLVKRMAQVARSFIQRRCLEELWPVLKAVLESEIRKRNWYNKTATYNLIKEIFLEFPEICILTEMDAEQINKSIFRFVCDEGNWNQEIKDICESQKLKLQKYLLL